jgi:[ribosomal protein S5]-alanine N-acetyltransferase
MMRRPVGQPIDIETARFRLRTLKSADASARWQGWGKDPEIMGPLNAPVRDMPLDYLANYATSFDNEHRHLIGIFEKASSTHIGFFIIEIDHAHRCATFNVVIGDKAWWGKGVVNETRAALLDHFFERRGIEKALGSPLARNFPAVFNYKVQGWRHEGTLRGHRLSVADGSRLDQYQFGLLREDWRKLRKAAG